MQEALGEPLYFAAPFVAVFIDDPYGWVVAVGIGAVDGRNHGVDAAFFADFPGLHNLVICKIMPQQGGDINQIPVVSEAVYQIAAAYQSAYIEFADFAGREIAVGNITFGSVCFGGLSCQKDFLFERHAKAGTCRGDDGFFYKASPV